MSDEASPDEPLDRCSVPIYIQLQPHLRTGKKLRVETRYSCHESLNGYLLGLSEQLGLMQCFHDFMPDGYTVFRLSDCTSIRSNEHERHWDRMLAGERLLDGLHQDLHVDLKSILTVIETISHQFEMMTIEVETTDGDYEFHIGLAISWDAHLVQFDGFDALGQWESESSMIVSDEIAFIQFDTPYINITRKYLSGSPPTYDE